MYIGRGTGAQVVLESEGNYLEGRAAVRLDKEIAARHGGPLTEERVEEILEAYRPDREDGGLWMVNNIYNTLSSLWGEMDGSYDGTDIRSAFPAYLDDRPLVLGYNEGWLCFLESGMYMMVFIGVLLVIALSPVFSEEYGRGTDALILTSRHGKRGCAWAKVIASYLFTLLMAGGWLLLQSLMYWRDFGLDGGGASVQLNNHFMFSGVPYFLTNLGAAGYCLVLWLAGSLILTAFVLLISALCRSWTARGASQAFESEPYLGLFGGDASDDSQAFPFWRNASILCVGGGGLWPGYDGGERCFRQADFCEASGYVEERKLDS